MDGEVFVRSFVRSCCHRSFVRSLSSFVVIVVAVLASFVVRTNERSFGGLFVCVLMDGWFVWWRRYARVSRGARARARVTLCCVVRSFESID